MKNLTALLAVFCALSCLTGCAGTEVSAPQTTAPETAAVTDSADTTATAAVTTTAAETTALSADASEASDTTGTADSAQTTASAASGTTGKTTTGTTGTTEPVEETVSVTLKGHVAVLVDDIITEYNETPCTEGYVVFRAYQGTPQAIRLPLDVCAGMSTGKVYTFEFADTAVSDFRSRFFFYTDAGAVCADYSELIPKYGRNANIREVQQNEYGLDCDRTECVGLTSDKIPKESSVAAAKAADTFKGEVIKAYSAPAFDTSSYDYILLLRDGEPALLRAKKGVSGQVGEGREYQFTFNKDGNLIKK